MNHMNKLKETDKFIDFITPASKEINRQKYQQDILTELNNTNMV